jgi:hypothetical protein
MSAPHTSPWAVALTGALALATAMGIGRFAFTPVLPMMLHDGVTDLPTASWLASANYLGYLAGALLCTFQPWVWSRLHHLPAVHGPGVVRAGLVATALLTLAMALPLPLLWPLWRFAAGVASAFVFVFTSGWCLSQLARANAPALGGAMYTGPGAGIILSGLLASSMVAMGWHSASAWVVLAALAAVLTAAAWGTLGQETAAPPAAGSTATAGNSTAAGDGRAAPAAEGAELAWLALAYGLAGFGYIVTATFLPVIARAALPGSVWLDLFWPLFGAGVMAGALLSTRLRMTLDLRMLLAACYFVQALSIAISIWAPTLSGFALSSVLLGLPFTAITFFAMHEVRRLRPHAVASTMGLLTALYGLGQIVGPPLAAALLGNSSNTAQGFATALQVAAAALVFGGVMFLVMTRRYPMRPHQPHGTRQQT